MQGLHDFVPTELKARYINQLLKVGFDTIDFGSFVSPKAIPQLRDTAEVLEMLELDKTNSKLLAIIANTRGVKDASKFDQIDYLGFPLSLSETFQQKNTNRSIDEAFTTLQEIQEICVSHHKTLVTYLSMGFGNPYGDPYEMDYVNKFVEKLKTMKVEVISLADTVGLSNVTNIKTLFTSLTQSFPDIEFGVHLHSDRDTALEKVGAAFKAGCRRFDGALNGFGGCPMADDVLVGNIATESIIHYLDKYQIPYKLDKKELEKAMNIAPSVFLGR